MQPFVIKGPLCTNAAVFISIDARQNIFVLQVRPDMSEPAPPLGSSIERFMSPHPPFLPLLFVFWGGLKSDMPSNNPSQHLSANPLLNEVRREKSAWEM